MKTICYAALFAAEGITAWLYLEYLFSRKQTRGHAASFVIGYAVLFGISFLDNTTINAAAFCAVNYVLAVIHYRCGRKAAVLHTAFLCFIMVGAEILVALLISLFGYEFYAYTYNFRVMVVLVILSKLLYLVFSAIGSRIFAPHGNVSQEPRWMILFCSLPLLSAAIATTTVYLGMREGITGIAGIMTIMIVVTLLIVNLIVLVLYNYSQKANEEHLRLQLSMQKEQADIAYYQALQEQVEGQRILVHDIKRHLSTIGALAQRNGDREVADYVSSLDAAFVSTGQAKLCTEPILNLILLRFQEECRDKGVRFHCDVRENISSFMDAASVTTLYGNLLSNALEAAAASTDKQVELSGIKNTLQSVIVISVTNSCDCAPTPNGKGGFFTRKKNPALHGVGLRSIERVVRRYQGVSSMYYTPEKKQFHHVVQFPVPS